MASKHTYRARAGLAYGTRRVEAGDKVSDLPQSSLGWLLEQGLIERVTDADPAPATADPAPAEAPAEAPKEDA